MSAQRSDFLGPPEATLSTASLPAIGGPTDWKDQRRLWGHAFHPMCSYLGAFPAPLAHAFVSRLTRPGDVVLDPYCGRGTVPLEAVLGGRVGVGIDANPLAHALTAAKVDAPSRLAVETRLAALRIDWPNEAPGWQAIARTGAGAVFEGPHGLEALTTEVVAAFHPGTLAQLLYLRRRLRVSEPVDRFLIGACLGILHGRSRGYLSALMPNGFSLAPGYAARTYRPDGGDTRARDAFALLAAKLRRVGRDGVPRTRGIALAGDALATLPDARRALRSRGLPDRYRLVMTSPPYLRTLRYGSANWLRLWFLGADPLAADAATMGPGTPDGLGASVGQVLAALRGDLTDDAVVVLVLGEVAMERGKPRSRPSELARACWESGAEPIGYRLAGLIDDPVPSNRKLTRLWASEAGRATVRDQILVTAPTELGRRRALAALGSPVDWRWPPVTSSWSTTPARVRRPPARRPEAISNWPESPERETRPAVAVDGLTP